MERRSRGGRPEVWTIKERVSIFRVIDAGTPFHTTSSHTLRARQRGAGHAVAAFPALVGDTVMYVALTPGFIIAGLIGAPVWWDSDRTYSYDIEPIYWEEYPYWFFARFVFLTDAILYDIPRVLILTPYYAAFGAPEWEERIVITPEEGLIAPRRRYEHR